jgi:hypothetical protein
MMSPSAGFVEHLFYSSLAADLRAGQMRTVLNGEIVSEVDARRLVAYAQAHGFIPNATGSDD